MWRLISANSHILSVLFHPRLAVSKWIVPRPFLMGGVLGFPTSFLVDTWRAKDDIDLPFLALYTWQAKDKKVLTEVADAANVRLGLLDYFSTR